MNKMMPQQQHQQKHDDGNQDEGWGWDAIAEDEGNTDTSESTQEPHVVEKTLSEFSRSTSDRSLSKKKHNHHSIPVGITSSPSFQELEKAIGATLALNESESGDERTSPNNSFSTSRSSTDLTQQKMYQQRMRQNQMRHNTSFGHLRNVYQHSPNYSTANTKNELAPFINEGESRALVIFHSPNVPQNSVRDVCSKYGVLYYIRPEFHPRGVTFISYFDLQAAVQAKEGIAEALGADADAAAHYSIMLHATNSNTEEYRLVVKNLPSGVSESDVQSIFARYGQLRSIQKTFGSSADLSAAAASTNAQPNVSYSIEYLNIQDARLAASELSATSATIWSSDTLVKFAPLDERKQQLCKQLLGSLSRWRTEMAAATSPGGPPPGTVLSAPGSPISGHHSMPNMHLAAFPTLLPPMPLHMMNGGYGQPPGSFPPMMDMSGAMPSMLSGMNPPPLMHPHGPLGGMFAPPPGTYLPHSPHGSNGAPGNLRPAHNFMNFIPQNYSQGNTNISPGGPMGTNIPTVTLPSDATGNYNMANLYMPRPMGMVDPSIGNTNGMGSKPGSGSNLAGQYNNANDNKR